MSLRAISLVFLLFPFVADEKLTRADNLLEFPTESIGSLYCATPEKVHFGAEAHLAGRVPDWEFLALAMGQVQLPEGKLIRLSLNAPSKNGWSVHDANWIDRIPNHAIHSLHVVNMPFSDEAFLAFASWSALQELKLSDCDVTSAIARDLAKLTSLKRLELSRLPAIDAELLAAVAQLPNLQELQIGQAPVTDAAIAELALSSSLTYVIASDVAITDLGVASLTKIPKLRALNLYAAEPDDEYGTFNELTKNRITDVGLEHIGRCPQLESLNIHGASVSRAGLQKLFARCSNLHYLAVSKSAIGAGALEAATNLRFLETIRITGTKLDDQVASQLSQLKNLHQIVGNLEIGNDGVQRLASLSRLESLEFSGEADDECMQALAKLHDLKELSIQATRITDDGLARLNGLPKLETVRLSGSGFTTRCLQTGATWPMLSELRLAHLDRRRDGKPEWFEVTILPSTIRSFEVFHCPEIHDAQLRVISTLANLERLSIQGNGLNGITNQAADDLARASRLKSLTMHRTSITDDGLLSLQASKSLQSLNITCLAGPIGLRSLGAIQSLNHLAISSPGLSAEAMAKFKEQNSRRLKVEYTECDFSRAISYSAGDSVLRRGSVRSRTQLNALEGAVPPLLHTTAWTPSDGELRLENLQGKVVLLDFWGTWCGACLQDLPRLREFHAKYAQKGLIVISIHSTEGSEKVAAYLSNFPFPWPNCCDMNGQTASAFAVDVWPSRYLIDRQGKLRIVNPIDEHLENAIRYLVEE